MLDQFVFSLNATLPLFLTILLGWFLRWRKLFTDAFTSVANQYVFKVALPVSLFVSISQMDIYTDFNPGFCLFCFLVTCAMFGLVWLFATRFLKDKTEIGAFSQASVRSSAALLGIGLAINMYGTSGMVPMMILSAVPFFNVFAVLMLTFAPKVGVEADTQAVDHKHLVRSALRGIVTNPIILGIVLGIPFALLRLELPRFLTTTLSTIGNTASPIGLLVIGAEFSGMEAIRKWKSASLATVIKLLILPAVVLPLAAALGFAGSEMVAILIMVGSPTTVACYVMAKAMKADTVLTSNVVVLTTLLSSATITLWIFLLRLSELV